MFLPLGLALVYLAVGPFDDRLDLFFTQPDAGYLHLALLLLLPPTFFILGAINSRHSQEFKTLALLSPCLLTPLAIFNAWTLAPGFMPGGYGYGGYDYFLEWLTKYPSFGPFNSDVLLGCLCVLASSFVPAVFAGCAMTRRLGRITAIGFLAIELPCLVAVILHLDAALLIVGLSFMSPILFAGPILRLCGAICMCAACVNFIKKR